MRRKPYTEKGINEAVAMKVMGWKLRTVGCISRWYAENGGFMYVRSHFTPTTNANHDYSVLKYVRENWSESDLSLFGRQLIAIRINRGSKRSLSWIEGIDYQIGDYAHAALAVKDGE